MNKCVVSVITPAYNCEQFIQKTYESICNQSFLDWEWIIIEDHSKDNSYEFIQKMIDGDNRVRLFRTEKNSGAAVARNVGIENAKGKYIAFLDADDLWKKDKLTKQIAFMEENNYSLTFTNFDILLPNGSMSRKTVKKDTITYKDLLKRNFMGCLTVIYNQDEIGKHYMPVDCEKREDHGAWLDITRSGIIAYKLDDYLSIYRVFGTSVSSNKFRMLKYQYRLYRRHEKFNVLKSLWYLGICCFYRIFTK